MRAFLGLILWAVVTCAHAVQVTLAWDASPSPEADGYSIHYGLSSGAYTTQVDVGNVLTTTLPIPDNTTVYFAATATATSLPGKRSVFSNEVVYPPPPPPPPPPPTNYNCPCSGFTAGDTPAGVDFADGGVITIGVIFSPAVDGKVTHIKRYKGPLDTGSHVGKIWSATGTLLASVTFAGETASGWQSQALATPLTVTKDTTYTVSVYSPSRYPATEGYYNSSSTVGPLTFPADAGVYFYGDGYPTNSYNGSAYYVDFVFSDKPALPVPTGLAIVP